MGKSYKAKTDLDYLDDMFEDDLDIDMEFEEDMEQYLSRQLSGSASKRHKGERSRKRGKGHDELDLHRLPRDWQDFDYASNSPSSDDWR